MKKKPFCHQCQCAPGAVAPDAPVAGKIVLVGNPNVGKSVFFGYLTGMYVNVSNYPGTTVEVIRGRWRDFAVNDTPGIYGVSSFNDEERVARDIILEADVILNVVDATHLERDLFLTRQLLDLGKPVVVALNFFDELKKSGQTINVELLSELLGVEVIPTIAVRQVGFDRFDDALLRARVGRQDDALKSRLVQALNVSVSQAEALLILEGDEHVAARHGVPPGPGREEIYLARRQQVNDVVGHVLQRRAGKASFREILGGRLLIRSPACRCCW